MVAQEIAATAEKQIGMVFGMMLAFLLIWLFYVVLSLAANYFLFRKIGENKWFGLVPILNDYTLFKHFWDVNMFIVYIVCDAAMMLIPRMTANTFLQAVYIATNVGVFVISILLMDKIRKAFGKGIGYLFGLMLLYPVFAMILAFRGNPADAGAEQIFEENRNGM